MDKEKFYEEDNEQSKQLVNKEGLLTKMARTGLLAVGVMGLGSKSKGTKYDFLNKDIVKIGMVASLTHILSGDDDVGGDLLATGAMIIGGAKAKAYRNELLSNPNKLQNVALKMQKYDDRLNTFSHFSANFTDWFVENFKSNMAGYMPKNTEEVSPVKDLANTFISSGKAFAKTLKEPFSIGRSNIKSQGFIEGSFKTLEDLSITNEMFNLTARYTGTYDSIENILPKLKMQSDNLKSASITLGEDGFFKSGIKTILNKAGKTFFNVEEDLFTINNEYGTKAKEVRRVIKHLDTKNNSFFQDMVGMYSSYSPEGTDVRYDRILKDKMHFGEILNDLASKYQKMNVDAVHNSKKTSKMTPDQREANFIEFLKTSGFGKIVDDLYKKDNAITFGDVNELVTGKNLSTAEEINNLNPTIKQAIKMGYGTELFDTNKTSYNENIVNGLKNIDLLKNFAFTNVVKKVDGQILDETALHGGLASLRVAGLIEKNIIAMYKNPFTNNNEIPISVWNPAKLIDANNRMKNILHNDIQKYGVSGNGYFADGEMLQWVSTTKQLSRTEKETVFHFISDGSKSYKMDFTRNTRDILDQSFMVKNENIKRHKTIGDLKEAYQEGGLKGLTSSILSSNYNPTKLRYGNNGFRVAKTEESYFTEGTILDFLAGNDFDYRKLVIDNRNIEKKSQQVGNMVLLEALFSANEKNMTEELQGFFTQAFLSKAKGNSENMFKRVLSTLAMSSLDENNGILDDLTNITDVQTALGKTFASLGKAIENPEMLDNIKGGDYLKPYKTIMNLFEQSGIFNNKFVKKLVGEDEIIDFQKDLLMLNLNMVGKTNKNVELLSYKDGKAIFNILDNADEKFVLNDSHADVINWYSTNYLKNSHKKGLFKDGVLEDFITHSELGNIKYKNFASFTKEGFDTEMADAFSGLSQKDREILGNYRSKSENVGAILKKIYKASTPEELAERDQVIKSMLKHDRTKIINYANYDYQEYNTFKTFDSDDVERFKEISKGLDFSLGVAHAKRKNVNIITGMLNANNLIENSYGNNTNQYILRYDFDNPDSVLNSLFEEAMGYDYYNLNKKYNDVYGNVIRDFQKNFQGGKFQEKALGDILDGPPLREYEKNVFNTLLGGSEQYRSFVNKVFKDVIVDSEEYSNYDYYSKFDMAYNKKANYFSAIKNYENANYLKRDKALASSFIIQSTSRRFMKERTVLGSIKQFVNSFLFPNKEKLYKSLIDGADDPSVVTKTSYLLGHKETNFGLSMKTAYNNLQNALEYIGVERITSAELGTSWQKQTMNMMKYRVLPMAGLVTGAIALNSFTDAFVPDEVPIIGNGAFGVATRGYATARVGLQYGLKYTGALSLMKFINEKIPIFDNGLTSWFDPLMDPSEMTDVYFRGKAVRVNKNRFWFTAGRQTGEGEEFQEYRPHLLYQWGNPTSGIYSNKVEKFFRQDLLLTKYPWYIIDPYKEEREMYENLGAVVPKTEQLFKDIPVFGHLLSMTIGEIIKPTQYVGEEQWRVGENLMKNPNYNNNNASSPQQMEFTEPNRLVQALFEGVEDLKTFSGLPGYTMGILTDLVFGASNPYENEVTLTSTDDYTSLYRGYEKMELGGLVGITEPIRRLLDDNDALNMIHINPLKQNLPDWVPGYFKDGRNPYLTLSGGYYLQGDAFDKTYQATKNEELNKLKILSMIAPKSTDFKTLERKVYNNIDTLPDKDKVSYYESLSYAENYGKRLFSYNNDIASNLSDIELKIDKKISPTEFMAGGKRYKIDNISNDFNNISRNVGSSKARKGMELLDKLFQESSAHTFRISDDPTYAVGTDDKGDFIKIGYSGVPSYMQNKDSVYRKSSFGMLDTISNMTFRRFKNNPLPSHFEKAIGKRTPFQEWSFETVESPYFRDWDSPITSFVEPIFNFSSNHLISGLAFNMFSREAFESSGANINSLGLINLAGMAKLPFNFITGNVDKSSDYEEASMVGAELEKLKFLSNNKSIYNMTGNENLKQLSKMVNESDSQFLKEFINLSSQGDRERILKTSDERLTTVLKTVWNRQAEYLNKQGPTPYDINLSPITDVTNIGAYDGNIDRARIIIKNKHGLNLSKLDNKRLGITKSYRGGMSQKQADFIKHKMYENYNAKPIIQSTIYPKGTMDIVKEE